MCGALSCQRMLAFLYRIGDCGVPGILLVAARPPAMAGSNNTTKMSAVIVGVGATGTNH